MGTTLTGTTPQNTYDSLIKVTDNGPLSGSLKKLTDGLGNDSSLSLSTTAASFSGSLTISGDTVGSKFYTAGSALPTAAVSVFLNANYGGPAYNNSSFVTGNGATGVMIGGDTASYTYGWIQGVQTDNGNAKGLVLQPISGNVGIGTTSLAAKLDVNGGNIHSFYTYSGGGSNYNLRVGNDLESSQFGYVSQLGGSTFLANNNYYASAGQFIPTATTASFIGLEGGNVAFFCNTGLTAGTNYTPSERARFTPNGLTFNGDTAAANALDDYEEGTWTPVDGSGAGLTFVSASGNYTKIGREVFYRAVIIYPSTGSTNLAEIGGLPFTVPNNNQSRGGFVTYSTVAALAYAITVNNTTEIGLTDNVGTSLTNAQLTGGVIFIGGSYNV